MERFHKCRRQLHRSCHVDLARRLLVPLAATAHGLDVSNGVTDLYYHSARSALGLVSDLYRSRLVVFRDVLLHLTGCVVWEGRDVCLGRGDIALEVGSSFPQLI